MVKTKDDIIQQLKQLKPILRQQFGIEEFAIFGSFARNENRPDSDIDIVITKIRRKNGFIIAAARIFLSERLGRKVDIGLYDALNPVVRKSIKEDLIYV